MKREVYDDEHEHILIYLHGIGVTDGQVQAEMADHLCIVTELYLDQGYDFDAAFHLAKADIKPNDLVNINNNAGSLKGYPKFLGKIFLLIIGLVFFAIFLAGIYMKIHHIPGFRMVTIIGRRLIGFGLLPMILLYNLVEYSNKTKQVLGFIFLFSAFQTVSELILHHKLNLIFLSTSAIIGIIWLIVFWINPIIKLMRDHFES
ncbi:hypothetical protein [Mucilaginibacter sp.]